MALVLLPTTALAEEPPLTFDYAYDVQRDPALPTKAGDQMRLYDLDYPLLADGIDNRKNTNEGKWTLTRVGTYSYVQNRLKIGSCATGDEQQSASYDFDFDDDDDE